MKYEYVVVATRVEGFRSPRRVFSINGEDVPDGNARGFLEFLNELGGAGWELVGPPSYDGSYGQAQNAEAWLRRSTE